MTEGEIVSWVKSEGSKLARKESVEVVEPDKADMDFESFHDEYMAHRLGLIPLTSSHAMSTRSSHYHDACDGNSQYEYYSIRFHLRTKCISNQDPRCHQRIIIMKL